MTVRKSARSASAALLTGLLALAMLAIFSTAALAVESDGEEVPPPNIDELCEEGRAGAEFCPETYEEPSWFQWAIYPLLIVGLVMVTVMLLAYLTWQPRFAREAEQKKKSRR